MKDINIRNNNIDDYIKKSIFYIQTIVYIITILILIISVVESVYLYFFYIDTKAPYAKARITLGGSVALALSLILIIECLKLYYIKTFKQLFFIGSILVLKLIINYFTDKESSYVTNRTEELLKNPKSVI